jgi:enterochelin esterase family protein
MRTPRIITLETTSQALAGNPPGDPTRRALPVYLPPGYDDDPQRRYPVIWVLAPYTGWGERYFNLYAWDENIVQRMDRLVREGRASPAILTFPDCFTAYGGSQYVNSSAVGRYEDYIVRELVPLVDEELRTLPGRDRRGVMGHSSGGFGALHLAIRHPDVFGAAASHSGDMGFEWCYWPDIPGAVRAIAAAGGLERFLAEIGQITRPRDRGRDWHSALGLVAMSACYSPNPGSPHGFDLPCDLYTGEIIPEVWQAWQARDPVHLARDHADTLQSMRGLYFDCGVRDEYNLFLGARLLHRLLDEHGVPHVYDEFDGGHQNINWRFDVSLPFLTQALKP